MESDDLLIENIRRGDEKAFKVFFESFYPLLTGFAEKYLNDDEAAKDIVQDAFVYFWKKKEDIFSIPSGKIYLYKYVKNHCLNYLRDKRGMDSVSLSALESEIFYRDTVLEEELYHYIYKAMQSLSPQGQRVIELTLEGHRNSKIAEILGITLNTVKTIKQRAFKNMRSGLSEQMFVLLMSARQFKSIHTCL
jgi:RNA polymerase sigma-70 factor (ECF subfamily)